MGVIQKQSVIQYVTAIVMMTMAGLGWSTAGNADEGQAGVLAGSEAPMMEEVVVRALRRAQDQMDVPVQVSVVSDDDLRRDDILTLEDLDGKIPNTFFGGAGNYGGATLAIRGIGGSATVFGEEPVATFIDDQYIPRNGNSAQTLLDVESIEILRGPQVTLYGRNATGGAILLRSARPSLVENEGYIRLSHGQFGDQRYQAVFGGPVVDDTLAVRAAVLSNQRDGWVTNTSTGESLDEYKSVRGRVSLLWRPADDTEVFSAFEASTSDSRVARARFAIDTDNSVRIPQSQIDLLKDGNFANDSPNFSEFSDRRAVVTFTRQFDSFEFAVDGGYLSSNIVGATDSDGTGQQLFDNVGEFEIKVLTENIRLVSTGDDRLEWIVGANAVQDEFDMPYFFIHNYLAVGGLGGDFRFFSGLQTSAYAAYAEGIYAVTDKLSVTLGARASYEKKEVDVDSLFLILSTGGLLADPPLFEDQQSWTAFKPRAIVEYELNRDTNLYASISTGFKSGGYNAFGQVPAYNEEGIIAYEVGLKGRYLDNRLQLNTALFSYDYKDLQLRLGVPTGGVSITNAGSARINGFEAEWRFYPIESLTLFGSISFLDATFKEFVTRDLAQQLVDASGNRLSRAPKEQYTLGGSFERPVTSALRVGVSAMLTHRGGVYFRETNQDAYAWYGEPLTEIDLRITVSSSDDRWELAAFVQNANDDFSAVNAEAQGDFPIASFNEPRKYGLELLARF